MAEMMLQLAAAPALPPGYQFVSIGDSGVFIREDFLNDLAAKKKKKGGLFKKLWDLNKKLALAPMRRSFRTLIAINVHGMAKKLMHRIKHGGEDSVRKKWEKMGGKYSELFKSIKAGAKRKALLDGMDEDNMLANCANEFPHFQRNLIRFIQNYKLHGKHGRHEKGGIHEMSEHEQLGVVQLAAVLAAAVPVIAALAPLMKKKPGEPGDPSSPGGEIGGTPVEKIMDEAKAAARAAGVPESIIGADPTHPSTEEHFDKQAGQDDSPKRDGGDKIFGLPKVAVIAGGAGLALYLLTKKK